MTSIIDWAHPSWVIPLSLHTTVDSQLAAMSANRRYQLRRTMREFEKQGALSIASAHDVKEGLAFFHALGELHTRRWRLKGKDGCFSRANWVRFHEMLIQKGFEAGVVQLLRIRCGDQAIGYIYNLVWRGSVLVLQTGFLHSPNNLLRAGYVSHLLAMEFNAQLGKAAYDLMPGSEEYKRVLARPGPPVALIRFQRRNLKFRVESTAVNVVRKLRDWHERLRPVKSCLEALACLILLPDRALEMASRIELLAAVIPLT
jgi:CelD/BcsL family acetyltransferase involved in cellulose biosynthesis